MTDSHFRDGVQVAWDSTSLKMAMTCLRYYKYKMIDRWATREKSVHLIFGGHYASALELYHKLRAKGETYDDAIYKVVHSVLCATWVKVGSKNGEPVGAPWESYHNTKTRESLIRSVIWYLDQFEKDNCETLLLADGRPAVEYSFTLDLPYGNFYSGHLDRVVSMGGELYIQDQKTTGSATGPTYFQQFDLDLQMSGYTFAGQAIFKSPIKGVIIDAAQILVGSTRFERGFTFRTNVQLDEWLDLVLETISNAQQATRDEHFPMNLTACGNYGGCEFRGVCSRSPEVRDNFLRADFTKTFNWNPLEKR